MCALRSVASTAIIASEPSPPAATKRWWRCSTAACGWSVRIGALELLGPDGLGHVARHEQEGVADAQLAAPDVDPTGLVATAGEPGHRPAVGHQQPRVAHEVGLDRADRREVELVVADDRDADAERLGGEAGALATSAQPAVGAADGLLEADGHAGGLVVVVLVADRVRDELRRGPCGHDPARASVTMTASTPLDRVCEPVLGWDTPSVSADVGWRSGSAMRPYVTSRRVAMGG